MLDSKALINRQILCTGDDLLKLKNRVINHDFRDADAMARARDSINNLEQQLEALRHQADEVAEREARHFRENGK